VVPPPYVFALGTGGEHDMGGQRLHGVAVVTTSRLPKLQRLSTIRMSASRTYESSISDMYDSADLCLIISMSEKKGKLHPS